MIVDKQKLALSADWKVHKMQLGPEPHHAAIVIDNFYAHPEYVRELALSLDYSATRGFFPGYEARISISPDYLIAPIRKYVDADATLCEEWQHALAFSLAHENAPERLLRQPPHPHIDYADKSGRLAGLVYLNLAHQCAGGTGFYRHRETQIFERSGKLTPPVVAYMMKHELQSLGDVYERMMSVPEGGLPEWPMVCDEWELTATVEMKFNRFVFYDTNFFHSSVHLREQFGTTNETRRITQTTFFKLPVEEPTDGAANA